MTLPALQDLFRRHREKATGVWRLGRDPGRTVFFDYGDTVFAQSTHPQDRLTYLLVERGKVTQPQMDYALANLKPGFSIGKNLIEMGFITQRDLLETAKVQVERIIQESLASPDEEPAFEERELDANVVRLPMNTPQILLRGVLGLKDRESLLELLGPLNQVVVLQARSLSDLSLPADLAKLPPLLDGTHTLLELGRESLAEPWRLSAFALFLREMGWARLHEMPPLDRHALDLALAAEPEPLPAAPAPPAPIPVEPEPAPVTVPTLFSTIQEAARPTTNLEHLSQALDREAAQPHVAIRPDLAPGVEPLPGAPAPSLVLAEPELPPAAPEPEAEPELTEPRALVPPVDPEEPVEHTLVVPTEPELVAAPAAMGLPLPGEEATVPLRIPRSVAPLEPGRDQPSRAKPAGSRHGRLLRRIIWVLFLVVCVAAGGYLGLTRLRARLVRSAPAQPPVPAPAPVSAPAPAPAPVPSPAPPSGAVPPPAAPAPAAPEPQAAAPEPERAPAPKPRPVPRHVSTTVAARLAALRQGDLDLAVAQGLKLARQVPPDHLSLRLEIACQGDTILRVVDLFHGQDADLFLLPLTLKDGRACYQVFYGRFATPQAAEKQLKRLPGPFRSERNRPRIFTFARIPKS